MSRALVKMACSIWSGVGEVALILVFLSGEISRFEMPFIHGLNPTRRSLLLSFSLMRNRRRDPRRPWLESCILWLALVVSLAFKQRIRTDDQRHT